MQLDALKSKPSPLFLLAGHVENITAAAAKEDNDDDNAEVVDFLLDDAPHPTNSFCFAIQPIKLYILMTFLLPTIEAQPMTCIELLLYQVNISGRMHNSSGPNAVFATGERR